MVTLILQKVPIFIEEGMTAQLLSCPPPSEETYTYSTCMDECHEYTTLGLWLPADINECQRANGGCSHQCHNDDGQYHCSCRTGYKLKADRHNCEGT